MNDKKNGQYVFKFECSQVWETLTETEDENIRHCRRCDKNVHFVQNHEELIPDPAKGNCIYSFAFRTAGVILPPEEVEQPPPQFINSEPQFNNEPKFIKRIFQFVVLFIAALPLVSFLPLYIERTMTRSQVMGNGGDVISYDWKIRTLYGFLSNYDYFRPEEYFSFLLAVNLILACVYAFVIALFIVLLLVYRKRR